MNKGALLAAIGSGVPVAAAVPVQVGTFSVTEQTGGALTNFQVPVALTWKSGLNPDFSNLILKDQGGTTLTRWIQPDTIVSGTSCTVWVKFPSIGASATRSCTYWADASGADDGDNVFDFFDGFEATSIDTAKWNIVQDAGARSWTFIDKWRLVALFTGAATGAAQGLCVDEASDSVYVGKDNGTGVNGTIYAYSMAGVAKTLATFIAPPHCNAIQIKENGNLIAWSAGDGTVFEAWEINPTTGVKVGAWSFASGLLQANGPNGAYAGSNIAYVHSASSDNLSQSVQRVVLNTDFSWVADTSSSPNQWSLDLSSVAIPRAQAPFWDASAGLFRLLIDDNTGTTGGTTNYGQVIGYRLDSDGVARVAEQWQHLPSAEREGLSLSNGHWYFSSHSGSVNRMYIETDKKAMFVSTGTPLFSVLYSKTTFAAPSVLMVKAMLTGAVAEVGFANGQTSSAASGVQFIHAAAGDATLKSRARASSVNADVALTGTETYGTANNVLQIRRQTAQADFIFNGSNVGTVSSGLPTGSLGVRLGFTSLTGASWMTTDWLAVRKFAATEPSVSVS